MKNLQQSSTPIMGVENRSSLGASGSLTANTAAVAMSFDVGIGQALILDALVKMTTGTRGPSTAITSINTSTDIITLTAHGFSTGQPVTFGATGLPAGLSATTNYFLNVATVNTFSVHTNATDAAAGTNKVDITSAGTTPTIVPGLSNSFFIVRAVVRRHASGVTALVGSPNIISFEDSSETNATFQANNTTGRAELYLTPDTNNATSWEASVSVTRVTNSP